MARTPKGNVILRGVAGECYVAAELSRMGYIASLTLRNTHGIDILASDANATSAVGILVKTTFGDRREWILSKKVEEDTSGGLAQNLFFVFVAIPPKTGIPAFHIVPRVAVVEYCRRVHAECLPEPGRVRKDSNMRKLRDPEGEYINVWVSLGLGECSV